MNHGRLAPTARIQVSPSAWVDACGTLCLGAYLWLAWRSLAPPVALAGFGVAMGIAWCATVLAWLALRSAYASDGAPIDASVRRPLPLRRIVLWCLVFRLVAFFAEPLLEDDPYRYLWDGYRFAVAGNPYVDSPADHFDDASVPEAFQGILDRINNPDVPTIYGPVCQLAFRLAHAMAPAELAPLKILLLLADLLTLWLLHRLGARRELILYAWCPLLIKEVAFTAHVDALGILFMTAALATLAARRDTAAASFAALAVASKLFALLIVPWLFTRLPRRMLLVFFATLAIVHAPFVGSIGASLIRGDATGLGTFSLGWEFNSSVFALVSGFVGDGAARALCSLGFALFYGFVLHYGLRSEDPNAAHRLFPGHVVFGVFFLLAPVANPWYLLWMLPFLTLRPSAWGFTALAIVSLSYVHGLHLPDSGLPPYHHPAWVRPVEIAAIVSALAFDIVRGRRGASPDRASSDRDTSSTREPAASYS